MLEQITWQNVGSLIGAVMGTWALIRTARYKAIDLRIPLLKAESDLRDLIDELPRLMQEAVQSRSRINGAGGQAGAHTLFVEEMEVATKAIQDLTKRRPLNGQDHRGVSVADLVSRTVEIHSTTEKAKALRERFRASLAADSRAREQIHADWQARANAMRGGGIRG